MRLIRGVDVAELRQELKRWTTEVLPIGALFAIDVRCERSKRRLRQIPYVKDETQLDSLVDRIKSSVEYDAKQMPGTRHVYQLEAYYGDGTTLNPSQFFPIAIEWADDEADDAYATHNDKNAGPVAVKHARDAFTFGRKVAKDANQLLMHTSTVLATVLDKSLERVDKLEAKIDKQAQDIEEARDKSLERQIKSDNAKAFREQMQKFVDVAGDLARVWGPHLANKYLGTDFPIPSYANPMLERLRAFFEVVSKEEKVLDRLEYAFRDSPVVQSAFFDFMSGLQDFRETEKAQAAKLAEKALAAREAEQAAKQLEEGTKKKNGAPVVALPRVY